MRKTIPGGKLAQPANPPPSGAGPMDSGGGHTLLSSKDEVQEAEMEFIAQQRKNTKINRTPPGPQREHHRSQSLGSIDRDLSTKNPVKKRKAEGSPGKQEEASRENIHRRLLEKIAELHSRIEASPEVGEDIRKCSSELQKISGDLKQIVDDGRQSCSAIPTASNKVDAGSQTDEHLADALSPGVRTIIDSEDSLRTSEILSQIKQNMEIGDIRNLIAEEWPARVYTNTEFCRKSILSTNNYALRAVLVDCQTQKENQVLKSLRAQVPVIEKSILQPGEVIVAESKDLLRKEGSEDTEEPSRLLVIGGLSSGLLMEAENDEEGLITELVSLFSKIGGIANQAKISKVVLAIPEKADLVKTRKVAECCFAERQTQVQICLGKRKKRLFKGGNEDSRGRATNERLPEDASSNKVNARGWEVASRRRLQTKGQRTVIIHKEGLSYSEILKEVKQGVDSKEIKTQVVSMRRSNDGKLIVKVKGSADKAEDFCKLVNENIPAAEASVKKKRMVVLHISDLDEVADKQEVKAAIHRASNSSDEEINVTSLRPAFAGTQKATVKVSAEMGSKLVRKGRILIGLVSCRVRLREQSQRCYRCGADGHIATNCNGEDKSGVCYNCGEEGHLKASCRKERRERNNDRNGQT